MSITVEQFLGSHLTSYYIPAVSINNFPLVKDDDFRVALVNRDGNKTQSTLWINHLLGRGGYGYVYACQLAKKDYVQVAVKFYVHMHRIKDNVPGLQGALSAKDIMPEDAMNEIRFSQYVQSKVTPSYPGSKCTNLVSCFLVAGVLNIPEKVGKNNEDRYYPFIMYERMRGDCYHLLNYVVQDSYKQLTPEVRAKPIEEGAKLLMPFVIMFLYTIWQGFKLMHMLHNIGVYHFDYKLPNLLYRYVDVVGKQFDGKLVIKIADMGNTCTTITNPKDPMYRPCTCKSGCSYMMKDWTEKYEPSLQGADLTKPYTPSQLTDAQAEEADLYSFAKDILTYYASLIKGRYMPYIIHETLRTNMALQKGFKLLELVTSPDAADRNLAHEYTQKGLVGGEGPHNLRYEHVDELLAMVFEQTYKLEALRRPDYDISALAKTIYTELMVAQNSIKRRQLPRLHPDVAPDMPIYWIPPDPTAKVVPPTVDTAADKKTIQEKMAEVPAINLAAPGPAPGH